MEDTNQVDPIDFDAISRLADEADRIIDEPVVIKRGKKKQERPSVVAQATVAMGKPAGSDTYEETGRTEGTAEPEVPPMDEELKSMVVSLVDTGITVAKDTLHYTEPGIAWRQAVGKISARLLERIVGPYLDPTGPYMELLVLLGYIGVWVGSNKAMQKNETPADQTLE